MNNHGRITVIMGLWETWSLLIFLNKEGYGILVILVILGTLKILVDPDEQICWNNGNYGNIGNMVFTIFF